MKAFMDKDFLLKNETAKRLFHSYAAEMPIIDYHCHIPPQEIAEDHRFRSITEAWLGGDHYKWRVMRAQGIDEKYITGDASDWEKFEKWASVMPMLIGNPLYHWTHLELQRYFGITKTLSAETAREIYDECNRKLEEDGMSVRGLIRGSRVTTLCTTDDPVDDLRWHKMIRDDKTFETAVLPGWRPDPALAVDAPAFTGYMAKLSDVSGVKITCFETLKKALLARLDYFDELGCKVSDHGIQDIPCVPCTDEEADAVLKKALAGEQLTTCEADGFRTALLIFLGREYCARGWIFQIHYGALRNNNSAMFRKLGANTGYDSVADAGCGAELAGLLNLLHEADALPKTVVYSLNPNDAAMISSILGCFWEKGAVGKMQLGAAWWFNDTLPGMTDQLVTYASTAVLGNFIGMLTDSRSFLSYTRHEYFRRILCNLIGEWVENGEYPEDEASLKKIVEGISYLNARDFLGLEA